MPYIEIEKENYTITVFAGEKKKLNKKDDNVDVQVKFDNGDLYTATFFTLKNLQTLFNKYKKTGECSSGLYFYCSDMILVENMTIENIEKTISDLINEDELTSAFDFHTKESRL